MDQVFKFGQQQEQRQQQPSTDMAEVLSARQYGEEAQNFVESGYLGQAQAPHSGLPLFNNDEQSVLDNFFNSPDDFNHATFKQPVFPFGYMPATHDNSMTDYNAASVQHVNALSHARVQNNGGGSTGDNGPNLTPQEAYNFNDNDMSAAYSIHNFRNGSSNVDNSSSSTNSASHSNNPFSAPGQGSWGALSFMNPLNINSNVPHLSEVFQAAMTGPRGGPPDGDQSKPPFNWANLVPSELVAVNKQSRDMEYNSPVYPMPQHQMAWQAPGGHPHPQSQFRPPMPAYGSDTGFAAGRYQSSHAAAEQDSKGGNLLNVPMAQQAAGPVNLTPGGLSVTNGRFPATTPTGQFPGGGSWGGMSVGGPPQPQRPSESQQRKRRLSQADQEDEAEWTPNQHQTGRRGSTVVKQEEFDEAYDITPNHHHKRRRSGQPGQYVAIPMSLPMSSMPSMQVQNSPDVAFEDEESASARKRRGTKKKENLSDSQKRANHIQSEKKRRELINKGYNDLNELVPSLQGGKSGLSRSECLAEVNTFLQALDRGSAKLFAKLKEMGVTGVVRPANTDATGNQLTNGA